MKRAEVRDGYLYVVDTQTGQETAVMTDHPGRVKSATVTGEDEVSVTFDSFVPAWGETRYSISTGHRVT